MTSRLILTPWNGLRADLLDICKESVKNSLHGLQAEHRVVRCGTDWEQVMFSMRDDAEFVAWVDADDVVIDDALAKAFNMIETSTVDLVYTDEAIIDSTGSVIKKNTGPRQLLDLASHPLSVHHLAITRRGSVDDAPLKLHHQHSTPLDWLLKVRAGCKNGMKRVPMIGYGWRRHKEQITAQPEFQTQITKSILSVRPITRSWINWSLNVEKV